MKKTFSVLIAALTLTACSVDPQAAATRRATLVQSVFLNPADQQGLDLAFPLESGGVYKTIEIGFFPDEVTEPEVRRRVAAFCAGQASPRLTGQAAIKKDLGVSNRTQADGSVRPVHFIFYTCV
ncbi:lipoprotein [Ruegeria sp. HKCCA4707]|uniref:lipoprotein n=1 Tax=Ruegeria sp. HKCCA4707 TaxID=2682984 RepID=UPI00148804FD|nr:lipoprotein [Ruegeria sp. HKCCA4707]